MKLKQNQRIVGVFTLLKDGRIKLSKAQKYIGVNQYKSKWRDVNAREAARFLNKSELVIK